MSPGSPAGPVLVVVGLLIVVVGLVAWAGGLSWFGRLPGDVRVERESVRVYAPFVSMLVLSLVVSLVLYVARRFF